MRLKTAAGDGGMDVEAVITYDSVVTGIMPHDHPVVGYITGVLYRNLFNNKCPEIVAVMTG